MASRFVRKVRTASGAVTVQVVSKANGVVVGIEHVGSAHTDAELAFLLRAAQDRLLPGQGELELGPLPEVVVSLEDVADWTRQPAEQLAVEGGAGGAPRTGRPPLVSGGGRVVGTASLTLWDVLAAAYGRLGFDVVRDEAFKALVLGQGDRADQ